MKYAYHPGNVAHSGSPEVAESMVPLVKSLGIELTYLDGATSCGAGIIRQVNQKLQLTLNARVFAQAESLGMEILTPCASCLLYTSPSPRDRTRSRMPSSA